MGRKIDYHDDPSAPKPNSLVPAVSGVVAREDCDPAHQEDRQRVLGAARRSARAERVG